MWQIEYIFVRSLYFLVGLIPFRSGAIFSRFLAFSMRNIFFYRRTIVQKNLRMAFPQYERSRLNHIEKEVYSNFAMLWIEVLQNFRLSFDFFQKHFTVYNWDIVEQAHRENKGIIFSSSHFGNYEWLGAYIAHTLSDFYVITQRIRNPKVHAFLLKTRAKTHAFMIDRKIATKKGVELLLAKKNLGIITDQDARAKGIFVNFFGLPSSTAVGTAYFHLRTGAALIFCLCIRKKWGEFELHFERMPDFYGHPVDDENIYRITQYHTRLLEKWVSTYPGQYFWTHRRWKTEPTPEQMAKYSVQQATFTRTMT
jgi:KDO2-lipid IV(A) lauroyltransferase